MATINTNQTTSSVYDQINAQNKSQSTQTSQTSSDSDMFMQLMIAQLQNQDPTSPAETNDFMQQISSMSQVESINNLNVTMNNLSNSLLSSQSALQASSMVGQNVYAKTDVATITADNKDVKGIIELPISTTNLRVSIYDSNGAKIETLDLGAKNAGDLNFAWNAGDAASGDYRVVAEAATADGYKVANSYLSYNVNSVTLGQNGVGMKLNTDAGSIAFSDIKQIG
ncbi:flagellar hook capping FlgD N-terminal domain-containing protein [Aliamphritea ceti]|uniref:flagellar hook capping FlgD N-terminal domain-containing protein n=1 Tax=Aliamphritea ceti TaxID=1524258 RepID=UPI0021C2D64F|nr:flagellar hook capping FlgD N-terminal domain-containing protein [Aliamphritea ceti]